MYIIYRLIILTYISFLLFYSTFKTNIISHRKMDFPADADGGSACAMAGGYMGPWATHTQSYRPLTSELQSVLASRKMNGFFQLGAYGFHVMML